MEMKPFQKEPFQTSGNGGHILSLCRTNLLTDSANCYSAVLAGKSNASERTVRVQLAYLRVMAGITALTFIDKDYNLTDSLSKTKGGQHSLLLNFLRYSSFRIGFVGRSAVKDVMQKNNA